MKKFLLMIKNTIFIFLGLFSLLGTIAMLNISIAGSIFYLVLFIISLFIEKRVIKSIFVKIDKLLKTDICPICQNEIKWYKKSGLKFQEHYICMKCSNKLIPCKINIFNIKKYKLEELRKFINLQDWKAENKCNIYKPNTSNIKIDKNLKTKYISNVELANKILDLCPYQPYLNFCIDKQVKKICKECKCRQDAINKAIEICGEPDTDEKLRLYARAYGNSVKEYRTKAIFYLNLYLNNKSYKDESDFYEMLADIYVKEYTFEKALLIYEQLIKYEPDMPILYSKKVDVMIKMNKIDEAIIFLDNTKKTTYYRKYNKYSPNSWFIDTIDNLVKNCKIKKEKGYIYKPKNKSIN